MRMEFLKLSWKNIITRPLGALLSIILLGLSIMLISVILHVGKQFEQILYRNIEGVDMVLGAKGSPLQLILSAIFQIDAPTGNIPINEANKLAKNPLVKNAIPLAYGDSYQGFRIVGTEKKYLELYSAKLLEGVLFQQPFEIVVGATVAQQLKLSLGSTFYSQHGFDSAGEEHDNQTFKVVGILKPNGTVIDKLLLTPLSSVWEAHTHVEDMEEHDHENSEPHHHHLTENHEMEEEREITAMLIKFRSPMGLIQIPRFVNENTSMQSAIPTYEIHRLLALMEGGIGMIQWLALFIMIVSCFSIFIGLFNTMKERKYEMALLRNFGASRWQLVRMVLQESLILILVGFGIGVFFSRLTFWGFSNLSYTNYNFYFSTEWFLIEELYLMLAVLFLGVLTAVIPAIQVFNLQISRLLAEQ